MDSGDETRRAWIPPMSRPESMIRLVKLPGDPSLFTSLAVKLETHVMAEAPPYNALSYTWTCPVTAQDEVVAWNSWRGETALICNGTKIPAGHNLLLALHSLLVNFPEFRDSYCWIDAVCIDQDDPVEKLAQIRLMGDIYSSAALVIVWVGPSYGRASILGLLHRRVHNLTVKGLTSTDIIHRRDEVRAQVFEGLLPDHKRQAFDQAMRFFGLRWWSRLWTYQEFVLAPAKAFICGEYVFGSDKLRILLNLFQGTSSVDRELSLRAKSLQTTACYDRLLFSSTISKIRTSPEEFVSRLYGRYGCNNTSAILMELLTRTVNTEATVLMDKILGLIGIARVIAQRLGHDAEDYGFLTTASTSAELSQAMTKRLVLDLPYLAVLRLASFEECHGKQPSWTAHVRPTTHIEAVSAEYKAGSVEGDDKASYTSGRHFEVPKDGSTTSQSEILCLRAVKVGGVERAHYLLSNMPEGYLVADPGADVKIITSMMVFCSLVPAKYKRYDDPDNGLWRTLFFGNPTANKDTFRSWVIQKYVRNWLSSNSDLPSAQVVSEMHSHDIEGIKNEMLEILGPDVLPACAALVVEFRHSRESANAKLVELGLSTVFSRLSNNYSQTLLLIGEDRIGITTRNCRKDDQIWILQGADSPSILRPIAQRPGHFRLIGQAYVDGIMQGEFIRDRGADPEWESIRLV